MKTTLLMITMLLASCAATPENTALAREAAYVALSEYQRQHPVVQPTK